MATGAGGRFLKLAGMTASIAGKAAKNSLKSFNASEEEKAKARTDMMQTIGLQIADTLGEMKGAVMKVGQIASQYKEVFPPEVAKALEQLQRNAPAMAFSQIKNQVEKELGKPINDLFANFEETPFAAASIGQVHHATLLSGEKVVVKVQYPGVDENCDSDLKQVRMALKIAGVLNMDKQLQDAIFAEIRDSLYDELDYTLEAHNLQVFHTFHSQIDTGLIIPQVYTTYSSKRVLTLSEETGETLETASQFDETTKTTIAKRLFNFSASQLIYLNKIHCDPHPGNFAFRENGDVVAYDFGGVRSYSKTEVKIFQRFMRHALKGDTTALEQDLISLDVRKHDDEFIHGDYYKEWLDLCLPAVTDTFDYGNSNLHFQVIKQAHKSLKYWRQFQPSATTMMLDRTISGQYWNLVNLKTTVNFSDLLHDYVNAQFD